MKTELPQDIMILFSYINTLLRDKYPSLDLLCDDMHINRQELEEKLRNAGFEYSAENNKFW